MDSHHWPSGVSGGFLDLTSGVAMDELLCLVLPIWKAGLWRHVTVLPQGSRATADMWKGLDGTWSHKGVIPCGLSLLLRSRARAVPGPQPLHAELWESSGPSWGA